MPRLVVSGDSDDEPEPYHGPLRPEPRSQKEIMEQLEKVPLFMTKLDDNAEDNVTLQALQALVYDGTPEEIALNFKNQGNDAFKEGPKAFRTALEYYTKGIAAGANDNELNSILYSNRAAVHLELKNYRKAVNDCADAIKLNSKNVKACYRSVRALFLLERLHDALDSCEWGLKIEPTNKALLQEKANIEKRMKELDEKEKLRKQREEEKEAAAAKLYQAIKSRGITMVPSTKTPRKRGDPKEKSAKLESEQLSGHSPAFDGTGLYLTFPVLFLYPEHSESDLISAFHEEDAFKDHLEVMFGEGVQRPGWDLEGKYTPSTIEIYFETRPDLDANPAPDAKRRLLKVAKDGALGEVLQHEEFRLVDGIATFFVLSIATPFAKTFKKSYKNK